MALPEGTAGVDQDRLNLSGPYVEQTPWTVEAEHESIQKVPADDSDRSVAGGFDDGVETRNADAGRTQRQNATKPIKSGDNDPADMWQFELRRQVCRENGDIGTGIDKRRHEDDRGISRTSNRQWQYRRRRLIGG